MPKTHIEQQIAEQKRIQEAIESGEEIPPKGRSQYSEDEARQKPRHEPEVGN